MKKKRFFYSMKLFIYGFREWLLCPQRLQWREFKPKLKIWLCQRFIIFLVHFYGLINSDVYKKIKLTKTNFKSSDRVLFFSKNIQTVSIFILWSSFLSFRNMKLIANDTNSRRGTINTNVNRRHNQCFPLDFALPPGNLILLSSFIKLEKKL